MSGLLRGRAEWRAISFPGDIKALGAVFRIPHFDGEPGEVQFFFPGDMDDILDGTDGANGLHVPRFSAPEGEGVSGQKGFGLQAGHGAVRRGGGVFQKCRILVRITLRGRCFLRSVRRVGILGFILFGRKKDRFVQTQAEALTLFGSGELGGIRFANRAFGDGLQKSHQLFHGLLQK